VLIISAGTTAAPIGQGLLTVSLTPSNATHVRPGWRIRGLTDTNFITSARTTQPQIGGGSYPIEFKPVPAFLEPSNVTVSVAVGQEVIVQAIYIPVPPLLSFSYSNGLRLDGVAGASYRVEHTTNLSTAPSWRPLTTQTLGSSSILVSNTRPASIARGFYRAVLVP
jgi:hypothetical protein